MNEPALSAVRPAAHLVQTGSMTGIPAQHRVDRD